MLSDGNQQGTTLTAADLSKRAKMHLKSSSASNDRMECAKSKLAYNGFPAALHDSPNKARIQRQ